MSRPRLFNYGLPAFSHVDKTAETALRATRGLGYRHLSYLARVEEGVQYGRMTAAPAFWHRHAVKIRVTCPPYDW